MAGVAHASAVGANSSLQSRTRDSVIAEYAGERHGVVSQRELLGFGLKRRAIAYRLETRAAARASPRRVRGGPSRDHGRRRAQGGGAGRRPGAAVSHGSAPEWRRSGRIRGRSSRSRCRLATRPPGDPSAPGASRGGRGHRGPPHPGDHGRPHPAGPRGDPSTRPPRAGDQGGGVPARVRPHGNRPAPDPLPAPPRHASSPRDPGRQAWTCAKRRANWNADSSPSWPAPFCPSRKRTNGWS